MEEIKLSVTLGDILWILGFIGAGVAFYKTIKEFKRPNEELRKQVEVNKKTIENGLDTFKHISSNYEIIIECLFTIINHELDGNSIDKLKTMRDKLQRYLVK